MTFRAGKTSAEVPGQDGPARRALFLDRDGVINVDHGYVHTPEATEWIPGVFDFCKQVANAGYALVVVTNQAGIARGMYDEQTFLAYTSWVHAQFEQRGISVLQTYYCPHHPTEGVGSLKIECDCRKPAPGLLLRAARDHGLDLGRSILLGDKPSDTQAGNSAGVGRCHLLRSGSEAVAFEAVLRDIL